MELIKTITYKNKKTNKYLKRGLFLCKSCGSHVERRMHNGKRDITCGCVRKNMLHGDSSKRLHNVWTNMMQRCFNSKVPRYRLYGGRGIKVCQGWKKYKVFKLWALENGYNENLQIDRIDNDGNYCPENCHFVTNAQNNRNTSRTKLDWPKVWIMRAFCKDRLLSHKRIAEIFGVSKEVVSSVSTYRNWKI